MISLDALIGIETTYIFIMLIITGFCIAFEARRPKRNPVALLFISVLVMELSFIIFGYCCTFPKKHMLTEYSAALESEHFVFRGFPT